MRSEDLAEMTSLAALSGGTKVVCGLRTHPKDLEVSGFLIVEPVESLRRATRFFQKKLVR